MADINKDTGLPNEISLADVFADIKLSPAYVTALLHNLAFPHFGGPNDELGRQLAQHGNKVSDPASYGNAPDAGPDNPQARWGQQSTAQQGQSSLPASGTLTEPSWMADARAAGWEAPESPWQTDARAAGWQAPDVSQPPAPTSPGSPPPTAIGSDRPRHYDSARNAWVYNDTGEAANVSNAPNTSPAVVAGASPATPPQPTPPLQP